MGHATQHGGCLCGAVRFAISGDAVWSGHCHCASCRRFSGSAMTTWLGIADTAFAITQGEIRWHRTADGVVRGFCADCGASLTYSSTRFANYLQIHAGALDAPHQLVPQAHVHVGEQLPWLQIDDGLPRFVASAADAEWRSSS
ncbi:MAG: GFA family protein [Pseudomonadota bacterium]